MSDVARLPGVENCPICNARAARVLGEGTEYLCGACVVPTTHGSWSIATACSVGVQRPAGARDDGFARDADRV